MAAAMGPESRSILLAVQQAKIVLQLREKKNKCRRKTNHVRAKEDGQKATNDDANVRFSYDDNGIQTNVFGDEKIQRALAAMQI